MTAPLPNLGLELREFEIWALRCIGQLDAQKSFANLADRWLPERSRGSFLARSSAADHYRPREGMHSQRASAFDLERGPQWPRLAHSGLRFRIPFLLRGNRLTDHVIVSVGFVRRFETKIFVKSFGRINLQNSEYYG